MSIKISGGDETSKRLGVIENESANRPQSEGRIYLSGRRSGRLRLVFPINRMEPKKRRQSDLFTTFPLITGPQANVYTLLRRMMLRRK